ncbi:hypothetical protein [Mucilaginibacter dorajii]|uniref:Uncharacterized protein n=1 Tax=Mucilaginibacter dorajii TaxID=692994 RepID=A0ABP7QFU9_9SPHI|nr:hypothetical protein [Mucilaginibacter dorajii]MCS3736044.1 hypothetical protein [Mucilaginibacter dorajii]
MAKLQLISGPYLISADSKPAYSKQAMDNLYSYDADYWEDRGYISDTVYEIAVSLTDQVVKRVIIGAGGGSTTFHETSHVIESERLVICCGDTVFCLSIPDLSLLWKVKADDATCFEIYKYKEDYIIHGELEISRVSNSGQLVWSQGGADIFTTANSNRDDFFLTDEYVFATDWNYKTYKFNFD